MGDGHDSGERPSGGLSGSAASWTLVRCLWVLLAFELGLALVSMPLAYVAGLPVGLVAIAWAVCCVSTLAAHVAAEFPRGDVFVLLRLASGMACRTLLPLVVSVWAMVISDPPLDRTLVVAMVLFYIAGLAADSVLSVLRLTEQQKLKTGF